MCCILCLKKKQAYRIAETAGGYESMITKYISELVLYGKANGLIEECDEIYVTNRL